MVARRPEILRAIARERVRFTVIRRAPRGRVRARDARRFDCNRSDDAEHGPIDTREELKAYDPGLAAHLAGFDPRAAGRFVRPPHVAETEGSRRLGGVVAAEVPGRADVR